MHAIVPACRAGLWNYNSVLAFSMPLYKKQSCKVRFPALTANVRAVCECILIPGTFYLTALGGLPAGALDHLGIIGEQTPPHTDPEEPIAALSIGAGLSPVPCKLVKRIQAGEFTVQRLYFAGLNFRE